MARATAILDETIAQPQPLSTPPVVSERYKWVVLSNTTLGMLMAAMNSSILLISLPAIFRGIQIDPLAPGQSGFLLWIMMGYLIVTATLVVTLGRISDMVGRVKMYNLGFAI
ncbi:MAG TPA: MFS transporter, partial [Chloroflexota bacterium]